MNQLKWLIVFMILIGQVFWLVNVLHRQEGEAKAYYLNYYHGIELTPEQAVWIDVKVTTPQYGVD